MKIGLALGGGGARGLAHIPLLEAFDELGLKPAVIAGCSMGALVAAAYAGGMSGLELREHALRLLSRRMDMARHVFGAKQSKIGQLFALKGFNSLHFEGVQLSHIGFPDNQPLLIEDHPIPLKIIATDFEAMKEVVLTTGPVREAVGASIAIPGVISAPRINGRIHVDGGIKNPVPFNHVTEGMDFVVAVDVTGKPKALTKLHPSNLELAIGSLLIMFHELADVRRKQAPPDLYLTPEVDQFGAADFFKVKQIFAASETAKDELKRAIDFRANPKA